MTHICGARSGISFHDLKEACSLTDGNLSRHLKSLETAGIVEIKKSFVGARPRTTITLTTKGQEGFLTYLEALEDIVKRASARAKPEKQSRRLPSGLPKPIVQ